MGRAASARRVALGACHMLGACGPFAPRAARRGLVGIAVLASALSLAACALRIPWGRTPNPLDAVDPSALAPPRADESWQPPDDAGDAPAPSAPTPPAGTGDVEPTSPQDLPSLLDLALRENPDTREAWESARRAAAELGGSLEPYFPRLSAGAVVSPNERILFQDTPKTLVVHQDSYDPQLTLTYTLLDFGRRAQSAELARQRLLAANFSFNRELQRVVFEVSNAYFLLDAATAMEQAARENVDLARKVREAAENRLAVGLATRPDVLLAQQVETRALYELENAHAGRRKAEAHLARTLGRTAGRAPRIEPLAAHPVPADLSPGVESLIDTALAERPDLAARVAEVRAAEAAVGRAEAELFPELGFEGRYGMDFWDYTFGASSRIRNREPTYATLFRLQWDAFRGFGRENAIRVARADSERVRAELEASRIDATVEVWSAYYEYRAAIQKLTYAEALLASAHDTYEATFRSYETGLSDVVALLTAERDLATARYTHVRARAEVLTGAAWLSYAAGSVRPGR